jgi:hypothetical protein
MYMKDALPIEELLPEVDENDRWRVIEKEINRLVPLVSSVLDYVEIPTDVTLTDHDYDLVEGRTVRKKVKRSYDLIDHYFELPREGRQREEFFRLLMQTLERGIGGMEELQRVAVRRAFSPITWLAWIVEIPIKVLARAGVPMEDASSKGVQVVGWGLRLAMFAGLTFAATRLGFSVPWGELTFLK